MEVENNTVNFKVSSALKDLVGRDLIRNANIALFELVKNSYDAFARKVQIIFLENKIIVSDNGKGMTFDDLKNKWLFLAYSAKKDGTENKDVDKKTSYRDLINRHYAGAKGVGRFSCDRLGQNLTLTTKNVKSKYSERLKVNWEDFEKNQEELFENIYLNHAVVTDTVQFPDGSDTGTILEVSNLRETWDRKKILELKSYLEKLINPFSETADFSIEIICNSELQKDNIEKSKGIFYEKDIVNGIIKNSIAKVISLKTTKIEASLKGDKIITTLTDRDEKIYKLEEKNLYDKLINVNIHLYFLNKVAKTSFSKNMGVQPVNYGSVFLFRNGFRILPFGNPGDDSWKLDYRSQQGYRRFLGTRDLFGRVDIQTEKIDEFKEVSSRDGGLVTSETTIQLFRLFDVVHKRLERYVTGVLWGEGFLKREYFKYNELVEKNRNILKSDKEIDSAKNIINNSLGSKIDFVNLIKTLINDKSVKVIYYNKNLANIFAQPTLFDDANLQVIDALERIAEKTNDSDLMYTIDKAKEKISDLEKQKQSAESRAFVAESKVYKAEDERDEANYERDIAKEQYKTAQKENKKLENKIKQTERENLFLISDVNSDVKQLAALQHTITHSSNEISKKIKEAMNCLQQNDKEKLLKNLNKIFLLNQQILTVSGLVSKVNYNTNAKKITKNLILFINEYIQNYCSVSYPELKFHIDKTNLHWNQKFEAIKIIIIINNLISNSIKAGAKTINIKWEETPDSFIFYFKDDGKGIEQENIEKVFDYRYSTTDGGGLGLYHVKSILKDDFCDSSVTVCSYTYGTEFKLIFKKSV